MGATINVIGSSSAGNAYVLRAGEESLLIEAGVRWSALRPHVLAECGRLRACLVSHEHKDHSQSVANVSYYRVPVLASRGTIDALQFAIDSPVTAYDWVEYHFGGFKVIPFKAQHDAAEPMGFFINHPECGNVVFATDTFYLKPRFGDVRTWLIECNYCDDIVRENYDRGSITKSQLERLRTSHMELQQTIHTLKENDLSKTERIVLIHLSDRNSDAERMVQEVKKATGIPTVAALAVGPQIIKL